MTPRQIIIVGPSGSGKSTVAQAVARELGLPLISMDDFRARGNAKTWQWVTVGSERVRDYESPTCWDGNAIACKIRACIRVGSGFVAEGNHLLAYEQILKMPYTERYYLHVPFSVSLARRRTRHRFLPADESFARIGERQTALYVEPQKLLPDVVAIDGTCATPAFIADMIVDRYTKTMEIWKTFVPTCPS